MVLCAFFTLNLSCEYDEVFQKLLDILHLNRLNAESDMKIQLSSIESDIEEICENVKQSYFFHLFFCFEKT